jgi:hypothetical protein
MNNEEHIIYDGPFQSKILRKIVGKNLTGNLVISDNTVAYHYHPENLDDVISTFKGSDYVVIRRID